MSVHRGISLLELVVVISVASLILALGIPTFEKITHSNRLIAEANTLVGAVHFAKNEAAKHYREVVICPSRDGLECTDDRTAWREGWLLFVNLDKDRPARIDEGEPQLLAHKTSFMVDVAANRSSFVFHHYARRSTNGTIIFCSLSKKAPARAVIVSYTGRPRVASKRISGVPYRCEH